MNAIINILGKDSYLGHETKISFHHFKIFRWFLRPKCHLTKTLIEPCLIYDLLAIIYWL